MREIKFRYVMKHGERIETVILTLEQVEGARGGFLHHFHKQFPFCDLITRDEFTGLKDKNGKEIYEGDILRLHYNQPVDGIVRWCEGESSDGEYVLEWCKWVLDDYALKHKGEPSPYEYLHHLSSESNREVIGNIHTNPELLK